MSAISMNMVTMFYLIASVCFIQALKGLSSPASARMGNAFGMTGMANAALTTVALILKLQDSLATGSMGFGLVALAAVNIFGGFLVTRRMLEMFRKKEKKVVPAANKGNAA